MNLRNILISTLTFISLLSFSACTTLENRSETAQNIVASTAMELRIVKAAPFALTTYQRIGQRGTIANIYIEGDGLAWLRRSRPSPDSTPRTPTALKLAAQDNSTNVIYIARPCQYSKMVSPAMICPQKYWTSHRFSPEVIHATNSVLDDLKALYNLTGFNLIGFSGGGAIAVLLAAQRADILSLRTVAGNLDHQLLHNIHNVTQLSGSLNPVNVAAQVAHIPQHHFISEDDKIVTRPIYESFYEASERSSCIRSTVISNVTHNKDWFKHWGDLLQYPLYCKKPS